MTDRPLGIADIEYNMHDGPDCWFWCRFHQQPEHGSGSPTSESCDQDACGIEFAHSHDECIRIGPFMSEREANRLAEGWEDINVVPFALGMEIES